MKRQKIYTEHGKQFEITATAILHNIPGNPAPYFSLTGEIWAIGNNGERKGKDCLACGMIHDEILKHWPDLKPLANLHLSDINGVPLHAIENGWYYYGGTEYHNRDDQELADHLRVSLEEVEAIHLECQCSQAYFAKIVRTMCSRWKAEAETAISSFNLEIIPKE
jgi:hypothetical protein